MLLKNRAGESFVAKRTRHAVAANACWSNPSAQIEGNGDATSTLFA